MFISTKSNKELVLNDIDLMVKAFKGKDDEITFPLSATDGDMWGYGIYCAKGAWVADVDSSIADEVIKVANEKYQNE